MKNAFNSDKINIGSGLDADEIWEEIICDSLGDMNAFASVEVLGEMNDEFLEALKEETRKSAKDARGPPRSAEGKASREKRTPRYIPYNKVGTANIDHINNELRNLYRGVTDGIADGIAIEKGNTVYIVDSGKENGKIDFGVRLRKTISNDALRDEYIRRRNNDSISKGYVSNELSSRLGSGLGYNTERDLRRESGTELSANKEKSADNQSGVFGKDADNRGLDGKASRDLDFVDFLNENIEERERSNREVLANLLETEEMSPSEKGFLTKYKNKIAQYITPRQKCQQKL